MSRIKTIDLSTAATAVELHETLAAGLGLPAHYGGSWDAFWHFVTEVHLLPDVLILEGLDALEERLPSEAGLLLELLGAYNNEPGGNRCAVEVSESYAGTTHLVLLEAAPGPDCAHATALGAVVNCWVKTNDPKEAERVAREEVAEAGWIVSNLEDVFEDSLVDYRRHDANRQYAKQACVDGVVVVFHIYDRDDDNDLEDDFVTRDERRAKSRELLHSMGVAIDESLPYTEPESGIELRSPSETARRVLCLLAVNGAAHGVDRATIRRWLLREGLWEACSPEETVFLEAPTLDDQQAIQLGWRIEALWLLVWAIRAIEDLAPPTAQVDVDEIRCLMPSFMDPTRVFVEAATMRSKEEVLAMSDFLYCARWAVRHRRVHPDAPIGVLDEDVIMERHYAINWLTRYGDADWDDVTCDVPSW